jgi:hypothetical protein
MAEVQRGTARINFTPFPGGATMRIEITENDPEFAVTHWFEQPVATAEIASWMRTTCQQVGLPEPWEGEDIR